MDAGTATHNRIQEVETAAVAVLPEAPKGKLRRLRKADSTEAPVQVCIFYHDLTTAIAHQHVCTLSQW